jgi:hypothetical protein
MMPMRRLLRWLLSTLAIAAGHMAYTCEPAFADPWSIEKCERYARDWTEALSRYGSEGLGEPFTAAHAAFIDRGCLGPAAVCPRSDREIAIANVMTIRAMNAGMASTFLPFACPR